MLIMLNTFGINEMPQEIKTDKKVNKQNTNETIPPTGRKIIF